MAGNKLTVWCTAALMALAASTSSVDGTGTGVVAPTHSATATHVSSAAQKVLRSIALRRSDLPSGSTLALMRDGDRVAGQVTLDNCGYDFTTERYRIARRQIVLTQPSATASSASNELVAYDTPAHAALALAQWHRSAASCPHGPVHSHVVGVPDLTVTVTRDQLGVRSLPNRRNVLTIESAKVAGDSQTLRNVTVLQVHGRYLDAVYLNSSAPVSRAALAVALHLATVTGRRLAAQH